MITLQNITLRNFMSVGNAVQTVDLCNDQLTLILGENLDQGGNGSRNGCGKAQPLYSKIKTPTGWTTFGDIKLNDVISTPDGGTSLVDGVYPQGIKKIYRFTFSDGRVADACEDHLWQVFSHVFECAKNNTKILTTKEIIAHMEAKKNWKSKHKGYIYVPLIIPPKNKDVDLPMDPYLLGCLLGDGHMVGTRINITTADQQILDNIQAVLPPNTKFTKNVFSKYEYDFSNIGKSINGACKRDIRLTLENLNLLNCRSPEKFIPEIYMSSSTSQKIRLLQGLNDTDGYAGKNGNLIYYTTSGVLAKQVQELIRSIGGIAIINYKENTGYKKEGVFKKCRPIYCITIQYHTPKDLVTLGRKKDRLPGENYQYKNRKLRIENIEYIGDFNAQCISVNHPDHLYITDDYVITHNTVLLHAISYALYGTAFTYIKKDNLINKTNAKNMMVTINYEKDGTAYRIERGRKPNIFKYFVNEVNVLSDDSDNEAQGDSRETQGVVVTDLGMSHNMFKNIVAIKASITPFLSMKAADQREVIEELLGITKLSEKAEKLKVLIKDNKDRLKEEEYRISATTDANVQHEQNISAIRIKSTEWEFQKKADILDKNNSLETLSVLDIDAELLLHDKYDEVIKNTNSYNIANNEIARLDQEIATKGAMLEKLLTVDIESELALHDVVDQIIKHETEYNNISKEISKLESDIASTSTMLEKLLLIDVDAELALHDKIEEITENEITHAAISKEIAQKDKDIAREQAALSKLQARIDLLDNNICPECEQVMDAHNHASKKDEYTKEAGNLKSTIDADTIILVELSSKLAAITVEKRPTTAYKAKAGAYAHKSEIDRMASELEKSMTAVSELQIVLSTVIVKPRPTTVYKTRSDAYAHKTKTEVLIADLDGIMSTTAALKETVSTIVIEELPITTYKTRKEVYDHKTKISVVVSSINKLNESPNPYIEQVALLEKSVVAIDYTNINKLISEKDHQEFLLKLLSSKDSFIRKKIVEQNLSYLNRRLAYYLDKIGLPHIVRFISNLEVEISEYGRDLDFDNLSSGEQARIILSLTWAFRDVFERLNTNVNLLFVDEILDGALDQLGFELSYAALKQMTMDSRRNIFLISHRQEVFGRIDNVLLVTKENGFSTITHALS